jgi:hypothetical protein
MLIKMTKSLVFSILLMGMQLCAHAQWALQPTAPAAVTSADGNQFGQQVCEDGAGGLFVFWLDGRVSADARDIYGQRYDAAGNKLWEEQGRLIVDDFWNISFFHVACSVAGQMVIVWYANDPTVLEGTNGLYAQELNAEGAFVWSTPLLVAFESATGALSAFDFGSLRVFPGLEGFLCVYTANTYGYSRIRLVNFSIDGQLDGVVGGSEVGPISFGSMSVVSDQNNGVYVYYTTGNGLGAQLMVMRFSETGSPLWTSWQNAAASTPGVGYHYSAASSSDGITVLFEVNQQDLYANRLDSSGTIVWNNAVVVCDASGASNATQAVADEEATTVIWRDSRPGSSGLYAVYGQRILHTGEVLWPDDGLLLSDDGGFDPNARIFKTDGTDIMVMNNYGSATDVGETIRRWSTGGELLDEAEGIPFVMGSAFAPGGDKVALQSGNNYIAVWTSPAASATGSNIHIARFDKEWIEVSAQVQVCDSYEVEGTVYTESGNYSIELSADTLLLLDLTIDDLQVEITSEDNVLTVLPDGAQSYVWTLCGSSEEVGSGPVLAPGFSGDFQVEVTQGSCVETSECFAFEYVSVVDVALMNWQLFPNPSENELFLHIPAAGWLTIFDAIGRPVFRMAVWQGGTVAPDVNGLPAGIYRVQWECAAGQSSKAWIKSL